VLPFVCAAGSVDRYVAEGTFIVDLSKILYENVNSVFGLLSAMPVNSVHTIRLLDSASFRTRADWVGRRKKNKFPTESEIQHKISTVLPQVLERFGGSLRHLEIISVKLQNFGPICRVLYARTHRT
jgi:hypothetical protein